MSEPLTFHPLTIPIDGSNLIEASAGTGKTWSIAALYLRLLLESQLSIEQILVVTYTKAATAELKSRLRARLNEALYALEHEGDLGDEFLQQLLCRLTEPRATQILRLKAAISQFDHAAIYTIHSFCQRVLQDHAFLSASPFQMDLVSETNDALLTLTEDFWRRHVSNHTLWAKLVFERNLTPEKMLLGVLQALSKPYLAYEIPDSTLEQALTALNAVWQSFDAETLHLLQIAFWDERAALNGTYYKQKTFESVFSVLQQALSENRPEWLLPYAEKIRLLTPDFLKQYTKTKGTFSRAALFAPFETLADALEAYQQAEEAELVIMKLSLVNELNQDVRRYNQQKKQRRFDDLLLDLSDALKGEQGTLLAGEMAKTWRVALIDEFQDTDPIQYGIFRQSFILHGNPVFLVGDPKQAIYSFRGADIFTYLNAADEVTRRYTLHTNYRSHQKLIDAISRLFRQNPHPFLFTHITYPPVDGIRADSELAPKQPAIRVQWLNQEQDAILTKEQARKRSAEYCAADIAEQLQQARKKQLCYQGQPISARDIAVLVSTHNQGRMVAEALKALNIDSVSLSQESVFASAEARALYALLKLWLSPNHTGLLRLNMSGLFFGYSAEDILGIDQNESAALALIDQAAELHTLWQEKGIFVAYQQFAQINRLTERLLQLQQERSLSNLCQLLELMATEEIRLFGTHALLQWLGKKIQDATKGEKNEEAQLRLESDENLVRIVTIHTSKGLQYPLVYCPFLWDAKAKDADELNRINLDGQSLLIAREMLSPELKRQLEDEHLAEQLRLLYVALTRAQESLYLNFGAVNQVEKSALCYLLFGEGYLHAQDFQAALKPFISSKNPADLESYLAQNLNPVLNQQIVKLTEAPFSASLPAESLHAETLCRARVFLGKILPAQRTASFSSLTYQAHQDRVELDDIMPQLDLAETLGETESVQALTIFHFPKGARPGLCLHELLEVLDFQASVAEQDRLVDILDKYGFERSWFEPVCQMLFHAQHALLNPEVSLSTIPANRRLSEMGFTFKSDYLSNTRLYQLLSRPDFGLSPICLEALRELDFRHIDGFLNGFIDMICQDQAGQVYVIDYKSNHLGNNLTDYQPDLLDSAIAEHHYYLQATLYAIATYRYFRSRQQPVPNIAVRYYFLRGLQAHTQQGIWQWELTEAQLEALDQCICSTGGWGFSVINP